VAEKIQRRSAGYVWAMKRAFANACRAYLGGKRVFQAKVGASDLNRPLFLPRANANCVRA
jgi:hypothetical protein